MTKRFDEAAGSWDTKPGRMIMAEKFANEIQGMIRGKNYSTAFEYGCGTGNVSFFLKDNFKKITLADISPGMIGEVQKKIEQSTVNHFFPILLNLENDCTEERFDVIYILMTLHHVKDIEKVTREFSKMLLSEGILIIGDLEKEDGNFHRYPENQEVHFGFEKEFLNTILKKNKLRMEKYSVFHEIERTHMDQPKTYSLFFLCASK